ncbi:MAG TPA: DUF2911 domain-containing protein [Chryseolinea sp.]|nr:DUF2911 domain-containing protein [Chryseolinea sp.]
MRLTKPFFIIPLILLSFLSFSSFAQEAVKPRPSPLAIISIKYKDAYVKITYSQPRKNGRAIFGELVPYNQVWRTGANEATEITLTKDITINGTLLKAGTYSIFTIPEKDHWTIIINAELGLWGSYNYNRQADVMRFEVPSQAVSEFIYEDFTMSFEQKNEMANLLIMWDNIKVTIPVKFINLL